MFLLAAQGQGTHSAWTKNLNIKELGLGLESLYCHSPTQPQVKVGIDKVMGWPTPHHTTHPPTKTFKANQEADFLYVTLF